MSKIRFKKIFIHSDYFLRVFRADFVRKKCLTFINLIYTWLQTAEGLGPQTKIKKGEKNGLMKRSLRNSLGKLILDFQSAKVG